MWACAFRATFISSISVIHLLILLYSYSFSKHCHSLHRETFEGGGTESFSETVIHKDRGSKHCHSLHRETFEGGGTESFSETVIHKDRGSVWHSQRALPLHAQSVNRNLVFHLIFVVRSQTCSESFVYYNFELCDIRSAEPMHASRKSNHASVQHSRLPFPKTNSLGVWDARHPLRHSL